MQRHTLTGAAVLLLLLACAAAAAQTRSGIEIDAGEPIPASYHSWSLFLVCSPAQVSGDADGRQQMRELHEAFVGFSQAIGSQNMAVWFVKKHADGQAGQINQFSLAGANDYDALRAGDFCGHYGLHSDESPFVVVTTSYPATGGSRGNYYAISLSRLKHGSQLALLGRLSDKIRASDLSTKEIDSDRYWQRWAQILEDSARAMGKLVGAIKFSVDVKAFKLEFDGGKTS